jgi:hypothetical protein
MRMKRILLKLLGLSVLLAGTLIFGGACGVCTGYGNDTFEDRTFPWSCLAWAVAGLLTAAGGVMIVLRAGASPKESEALNLRAGS